MDTITILRDLWRLRLAVVCIAVLSLLAGVATVFKLPSLESRKHEVGVAVTRILIDTPSSQVVEVAPKGSDTLGVRANLLASLMVDGVVKTAIAERAGLPPDKLVGVSEAAAEPAPAKAPGPGDFVLTTRVLANAGGDQLPLIEVDAQAPDRSAAAKLGAAAIEGLRDYLDTQAAEQQVKDADRLQVTGLGAPRAATDVRGPSSMMAMVVAVFAFALGCAGLLGLLAVVRGFRVLSAREPAGNHDPLVEDLLIPPDESARNEGPWAPVIRHPATRSSDAGRGDCVGPDAPAARPADDDRDDPSRAKSA